MNELKQQIKSFFKGDAEDGSETLSKYSRDYSLFNIKPSLVVFPKDPEDLKNLVKFAEEQKKEGRKISLTGRSGGTDMTGGPLNDSIIVEFDRYLNHIGKIGDNYGEAEPGVYFRDFEKEIGKHKLIFPPYPASKDICAIGGMVANNSGGEKSLAYGKSEDYVEELKVILSDGEEYLIKPLSEEELKEKIKKDNFEGEIYRKVFNLVRENNEIIKKAKPNVSKNSAGYNLWDIWDGKVFNLVKLFVGSQGTLGLISKTRLKLVPAKKHSRMTVIFLNDFNKIADLVVKILKFKPESLESYDDKTFKLALRFLPEVIKIMKGNILKLMWDFLPEFWMLLSGGVPKMILLSEFTSDNEEELQQKLSNFKKEIEQLGLSVRILRSEKEAEKYLTIRRQSFKLLHGHIKDKDTAPFIDDFIVKPEFLPEFMPKMQEILKGYEDKLIYTVAGHPGNGNFHIIPLMDLGDKDTPRLISSLSNEVYDLVLKYGGSITAEHNDGLIRTPYLRKMYGKKICELFKEVKNIFDPDNIFNPGKKVGGNLESSLKHLAK